MPPLAERLFGSEGVSSSHEAEATAGGRALECLMAENAQAAGPCLLPQVELLLDRTEAESLSSADLRIYQTPEGVHFSASQRGLALLCALRDQNVVAQKRIRMCYQCSLTQLWK